MAETFGDFGTPKPEGGPPTGGPMPDSSASKGATESLKDLTDTVKKDRSLSTGYEVRQEPQDRI
jgi:hypothetical protein